MGEVIKKVKNGKFIGWYLRYVDADGKRKQRASHQSTYVEARRLLVEIEARVGRGLAGVDEQAREWEPITVEELFARFVSEYSSPRIKDLEKYRTQAAMHLRRVTPSLKGLQARELDGLRLAKVRNALLREYPAGTVRTTFITISAALSWAVREGLIEKNVARGVERPPAPQQLVEWLSGEEVKRLLAEAELRARTRTGVAGLAWWSRYVAISFGVYAGLRKGELFGLRWQDVDVETGRLTIARSYATTPKSGKARHLRLPSTLVPILKEWKAKCPKTPQGLICPVFYRGQWGMAGEGIMHELPELLAASGCRPVGRAWHLLRHTMASHFIMNGGNILTLQKILGHADLQMTLVYAHLAPDFLGQEMERVKF